MEAIAAIFWNKTEHRLRSVWRLLGWVLLVLVLSIVFTVCASLIVIGVGVASGDIDLADPSSIEAVGALTGGSTGTPQPVVLLASGALNFVVILVSVWIAGRFFDRRLFADFGFRFSGQWWADLGFGMALGAVLMAGIFGLELAAGWITITGYLQSGLTEIPFALEFGLMVLLFLGVGIEEELFSRGYMLKNFAEGLNFNWLGQSGAILIAMLISSTVFGFLHASNPNASLVSTINLVVAGVFLAAGYLLTGELAVSIGLHFTWNLFQGNVFGFPVSGIDAGATLIAIQQGGIDLWTGGVFGPEAGLIGIVAILTGLVLIVLWVRLTRGSVGLHTALAVPTLRPPRAVASPPAAVDTPS